MIKHIVLETLLTLLGCSSEEKPVGTIPLYGYSLEQYADIPAKNSDKTAYYFFQKHIAPDAIAMENPEGTTSCQLAIQGMLETLYRTKKIDAVYFEGFSKDSMIVEEARNAGDLIDNLSIPNGSALVDPTKVREHYSMCTQRRMICAPFQLATLYPDLYLTGFVDNNNDSQKAAIECLRRTNAFYGRMNAERQLGEEDTIGLFEEKVAFLSYCRAHKDDLTIRRSEFAYFNPIQDAEQRGFIQYAVVIGKGHRLDITALAKNSAVSPKIVRYSCPD